MLTEIIKNENDLNINFNYKIFPDIEDRKYWDKAKNSTLDFFEEMDLSFREESQKPLTASLFMEYKRNGNRFNYEEIYYAKRCQLITKTFLECMHNDGRLMNEIVDLIWMILEESSWCVPAHEVWVEKADNLPDFENQTLDLFASETACTMAFVYQTLGTKLDEISTVLKRRIKDRVNRFILDDYLNRNDYWWMGFTGEKSNNWCPWINSNIIATSIILSDTEDKLRKIIYKAVLCLENYIKNQPTDGGCDEGATYWNQAGLTLLEGLWLLKNLTDGQLNFFKEEQIVNILGYFMKVYTGKGECVNFADGSTKLPVYYASIYKFSKLTENEDIKQFSKMLYNDAPFLNIETSKRQKIGALTKVLRMSDIASYTEKIQNIEKNNILKSDYYIKSIDIMTSKTDGDPLNGLYLAAKGGHNDESHNHNDVGHFIVYKNGEKFLIDLGNMAYTAITFSDKRYTLCSTRSSYHNVPFINGFEQKNGREYEAKDIEYTVDDNNVTFSLDISKAYENKDEIKKWIRTIRHDKRNHKIEITEEFSFEKEMEYELHFVTVCDIEETNTGIILVSEKGEKLNIDYDTDKFNLIVDYIDTDDVVWQKTWGNRIFKISLKSKAKADKINYIIY